MANDLFADPDWKPESMRRLKERATLILPEANGIRVFFDDEKFTVDSSDIICVVREPGGPLVEGFELVASRSFKIYRPLYRVLADFHPMLGRLFRPGSLFAHVGGRMCGVAAPGRREEYWARKALSSRVARGAQKGGGISLGCVTVAGIGFAPVVGATLASLVTALFLGSGNVFLPPALALGMVGGVLVLSTILSVVLERWAAHYFLSSDAREFVLDEVAGMAMAILVIAPASVPWGVAGAFIAFRFFDVLKPGIHWIEERGWPGSIVWDDLAAGLFAGLAVLGVEKIVLFV